MKKCEMPKPKFDVGDIVAYSRQVTENRADDVPVQKTIKGAGEVESVSLTKVKGGWAINYTLANVTDCFQENEMKRVNI